MQPYPAFSLIVIGSVPLFTKRTTHTPCGKEIEEKKHTKAYLIGYAYTYIPLRGTSIIPYNIQAGGG